MLTLLSSKQIEYIYNTFMVYDFPPDELKPLPHLLKMVQEGLCTYYAIFDGEEVLSYVGLCVKDGFALVDYLAVNPNRRGRGIGTETLELLKQAAGDNGIIIECEDPEVAKTPEERIIRQRRISFYIRSGFVLTDIRARLFGVDYLLLTFPKDTENVKQGYETVYRAMLGDTIYNRNMEL